MQNAAAKDPTGGPLYAIRVAARLAQLELDTLRMWERRYGFPKPLRTPGGSRRYTGSDIEALKLIRSAIESGYRPGEVVGRPLLELKQLLLQVAHAEAAKPSMIPSAQELLEAVRTEDVARLRAALRAASVQLDGERFVKEIAHPLSLGVGDLWAAGHIEVRHEHTASALLSSQLQVILASHAESLGQPRVLLSTLPGEHHELGLEMVQVYLAAKDVGSISLGSNTPSEQIVKAAIRHGVDAVGLLVTHASDLQATAQHVRAMLEDLPRRVRIWVGGAGGAELNLTHEAIRTVSSWAALDCAIAELTEKEGAPNAAHI